MKGKDERFPDYPLFKGLQRPLEFMGIQGRYIYWAAGAAGGAIVGFIAHIIGYTLVKIPLYGTVVAFGEMFTLSMQTIAGIVIGGVVYTILVQSPAIRTLKAKFA